LAGIVLYYAKSGSIVNFAVSGIFCGEPPQIHSGSCACQNNNYFMGATCNCNCDLGYIFSNAASTEIECQQNGWWPLVKNLPSCSKHRTFQVTMKLYKCMLFTVPCSCKNLPKGWKLDQNTSSNFTTNNRKKRVSCKGVAIQVVCKTNATVKGKIKCKRNRWHWIDHQECS
jgi:hypothetical protein